MQKAFEWMESREEGRRLASVLLIRELAKNSPTLVYGFVGQVFKEIWVVLKDPRELIRKVAAEAVSACFEITAARDPQFRKQWFTTIYDQCLKILNTTASIDEQHGALLILRELLIRGVMFMEQFYRNGV